MRKAPEGWTLRDFRIMKRDDFELVRAAVEDFLGDFQYTPIPTALIDQFNAVLNEIEWYIGTVSWGH